MLRYLEICCRTHGEFLAVSSGSEAIAFLQKYKVDILLSDVSVGKVDGYTLCEILRDSNNASLKELPVILTSSLRAVEIREPALKAGANAILEQPFKPNDFRTLIEKILNGGIRVC